jgi:tetratricopeptide (TPR) repeat protein
MWMLSMVSSWIGTIAVVLGLWTMAQSDFRASVDRGIELYYRAEFQQAAKVLSDAEGKITNETPKKDAADLKLFLGILYYVDKNNAAARSRFVDIYKIDPQYELPTQFKPEILNLIDIAKRDFLAEVRAACPSTCASLNSAIAGRNVEQIYAAVTHSSELCNCDQGRSKAALAVFDIAQQYIGNGQYEQAQTVFKTAVQIDPGLQSRTPGFGKIVVTSIGPAGQVLIDGRLLGDVQTDVPSLPVLLTAADHIVKFVPATLDYKEVSVSAAVTNGEIKHVQLSPERAPVEPKAGEEKLIFLKSGELFDLDTGTAANDGTADIMWYASGKLVPQGAAAVSLLPRSAAFESTTFDQLKAAGVRRDPLDNNNELGPGRIVAVRTGEGVYGKLRIAIVGSTLSVSWVAYR